MLRPGEQWQYKKGSIYFAKNIKTVYMFRLECIQWHNVATVVLKLFINIKNKFW